MLRRYLIELNTKTQYTQSNSIFWCFLLIWCNLIKFNLFWCKNIKIFVFCLFFVLNTIDRIAIPVIYYPYTHKKTCITSCSVKVSDRCSPTPLLTVSHHLTLYCSLVELEDLEISCLTDAELVTSYVDILQTQCYLLRFV